MESVEDPRKPQLHSDWRNPDSARGEVAPSEVRCDRPYGALDDPVADRLREDQMREELGVQLLWIPSPKHQDLLSGQSRQARQSCFPKRGSPCREQDVSRVKGVSKGRWTVSVGVVGHPTKPQGVSVEMIDTNPPVVAGEQFVADALHMPVDQLAE